MGEYRFLTVLEATEGLYKEKGSKFLSFLHPVENRGQVDELLKKYKEKYYDARHVCFAFRLGLNGEDYRAYDDGEPAHTAGDPILNQLRSSGITNVLLVVVRYFGGTKLGVSGLIIAYKEAAADAIRQAHLVERELQQIVVIETDFASIDKLMRLVNTHKAEIIKQSFDTKAKYELSVPLRCVDVFKRIGS